MPDTTPETRLSDFKPGDRVEIVSLVPDETESAETLHRLGALGFVEGTEVHILRRAPLGDPTEYSLRGTRISLRQSEANHIRVISKHEGA